MADEGFGLRQAVAWAITGFASKSGVILAAVMRAQASMIGGDGKRAPPLVERAIAPQKR